MHRTTPTDAPRPPRRVAVPTARAIDPGVAVLRGVQLLVVLAMLYAIHLGEVDRVVVFGATALGVQALIERT